MSSFKQFAQLDSNGVCIAVAGVGEIELAEGVGLADVVGKRWAGSEFVEVVPEPSPPTYSGTNFVEALGAAHAEIVASTEPAVMAAADMFRILAYTGSPIRSDHPSAQAAFDELVTAESVPSFTAATKAALCDPV